MNSPTSLPRAYTPDQVAEMLQLSTNTVYTLINSGKIVAKRIGKTLRVPASSLSFIFTGLDQDLLEMERVDLKNIELIQKELSAVRAKL